MGLTWGCQVTWSRWSFLHRSFCFPQWLSAILGILWDLADSIGVVNTLSVASLLFLGATSHTSVPSHYTNSLLLTGRLSTIHLSLCGQRVVSTLRQFLPGNLALPWGHGADKPLQFHHTMVCFWKYALQDCNCKWLINTLELTFQIVTRNVPALVRPAATC